MTYRRALGAVDLNTAIADINETYPQASQRPDPFALAAAFGMLPNTAAGRATFDQANGTYDPARDITRNLATSVVTQPDLAALLVTWRAINAADTSYPSLHPVDWRDVLTLITSYPGAVPAYSNGYELPPSVTLAQAGPYIATVRAIFPTVLEAFAQVDAGESDREADVARATAQAAALAAGATQTPYGPVATSLIAQGPVTLPDGNVYLVVNDVSGDPALSYVLWWRNAQWVAPFGVTHYGDECGWLPGTGDWYMLGAAGATCPAPPAGWRNDGFALVSARARASIFLNSDATLPSPGTDDAPSIYTGPTVQPPPTNATGGGVVVTIDPGSAPVDTTPPVIIGTLPPANGGGLPMPTPLLFDQKGLALAAGAAALLALVAYHSGKGARR